MSDLEEKVIALSKIKITVLTVLAFGFVALGVFLLSLDANELTSSRRFSNTTLVHAIGIVTIVFFGLCALLLLRKLFETSPGLILNAEGLIDNSSSISAGLIPWSEITGIGEYKIHSQKFVSIFVTDPHKYADMGNALTRMTNRANIRMCGTPINISANGLKIKYQELVELIEAYSRQGRREARE